MNVILRNEIDKIWLTSWYMIKLKFFLKNDMNIDEMRLSLTYFDWDDGWRWSMINTLWCTNTILLKLSFMEILI